jgi:GT2 family glycosyltransferase
MRTDKQSYPEQTGGGFWCCELELSSDDGLVSVTRPDSAHHSVRVLIRFHGEPLGYLAFDTPPAELQPQIAVTRARGEYAARIEAHLAAEQTSTSIIDREPLPGETALCPNHIVSDDLVSVVVCTRNRSEMLPPCLDRLAALTYERLEILIVDNAPSDGSTKDLIEARAEVDPRFRYVLESRPGLSAARNRGLAEARGRFVAYTDDDVAVDARWVQGLLRGFQSTQNVGCVTGLVCTAEIVSAAEAYFDARSPSWSTRCEREVFDLGEHRQVSALYPYSAGIYGTGANFAFDREVLLGLGPFDEALGAGTKTRGGEDLDMFVRVLQAGKAIVYEPSSIVWHHHRADDTALLSQMFGYGTGLTAYLTKLLLRPSTRWEVLRRVPAGLVKMANIRRSTGARLTQKVKAPRRAWSREVSGYAAGPWLYLREERSRRARVGNA